MLVLVLCVLYLSEHIANDVTLVGQTNPFTGSHVNPSARSTGALHPFTRFAQLEMFPRKGKLIDVFVCHFVRHCEETPREYKDAPAHEVGISVKECVEFEKYVLHGKSRNMCFRFPARGKTHSVRFERKKKHVPCKCKFVSGAFCSEVLRHTTVKHN